MDVWYCLYVFVCPDLVLDVPLIKYLSAGMSVKSLIILYRRVSRILECLDSRDSHWKCLSIDGTLLVLLYPFVVYWAALL